MTERERTGDLIWEGGHLTVESCGAWARHDEGRRYYLNINTTASCTGNLPLQPLSLLAWFPLLLQFPCISSSPSLSSPNQARGGGGGSKKVSTDRLALLVPSGIYIKVSPRQNYAPSLSITVPALLQCYSDPVINTSSWAEYPTRPLG